MSGNNPELSNCVDDKSGIVIIQQVSSPDHEEAVEDEEEEPPMRIQIVGTNSLARLPRADPVLTVQERQSTVTVWNDARRGEEEKNKGAHHDFPLFNAKCPWCPVASQTISKLRRHALARHKIHPKTSLKLAEECKHKCMLCGSVIKRLHNALQHHLLHHHNREGWTKWKYLTTYYESVVKEESSSSLNQAKRRKMEDLVSLNVLEALPTVGLEEQKLPRLTVWNDTDHTQNRAADDNKFPLFSVKCPWCSSSYQTIVKLHRHAQRSHHMKGETELELAQECKHRCRLCGKVIKRIHNNLLYHLSKEHKAGGWTKSAYLNEFYDSVVAEESVPHPTTQSPVVTVPSLASEPEKRQDSKLLEPSENQEPTLILQLPRTLVAQRTDEAPTEEEEEEEERPPPLIVRNDDTARSFKRGDDEFPLFRARCPSCPMTFQHLKKLQRHAQYQHGMPEATEVILAEECKHRCRLCGTVVKRLRSTLATHVAKEHKTDGWTPWKYLNFFYQSVVDEESTGECLVQVPPRVDDDGDKSDVAPAFEFSAVEEDARNVKQEMDEDEKDPLL